MKAEVSIDPARASDLLRQGGLVAIPTETVYGLAANAFNAEAVLRIFEVKQRPAFDPLIIHVRDRAQVDLVAHVPPEAEVLIRHFWPGPLTLVLPKKPIVPDIVTSGLDTVGVRMPAHPLAQQLLQSLDFPLAAPSANPFGYVSPTTAQHVADQLGDRIPYILDGGPCSVGVESTIIGWEPVHTHHTSHLTPHTSNWALYRAGGIPVETIEAVIGTLGEAATRVLPAAPGMIESHYAPRTPVHVGDVDELLRAYTGKRCAVIAFHRRYDAWRCATLSPAADPAEAARNLFSTLRGSDTLGADVILAEVFPEKGLGRAINDRLRRASAGRLAR